MLAVGCHKVSAAGFSAQASSCALLKQTWTVDEYMKRPVSWRRKGGLFFYKRDRGFQQLERPFFLAVEDPQDVTNDLAKGSYAIQKVSTGPQLKLTVCHDHPVRGSHMPHVTSGGCVL